METSGQILVLDSLPRLKTSETRNWSGYPTLWGNGITDQIKGLNTEYGTFVDDSITAMNAPENDFASQIGGHIDSFQRLYR